MERCPLVDMVDCGAVIGATGAGAAGGGATGGAAAAGRAADCCRDAGGSGTPNVGRSAIACAGAGGLAGASAPPLPGRRTAGASVGRAPSGATDTIVVA